MSDISPYTRKFFLDEIERILESGDVEKDIRPILIFQAQTPTKLTECLHWSGNKWTATFEEQEAFRMVRSRDDKERAMIEDEAAELERPTTNIDGLQKLAAACSLVLGDCPNAPSNPHGACKECSRTPICEALQELDKLEGRV